MCTSISSFWLLLKNSLSDHLVRLSATTGAVSFLNLISLDSSLNLSCCWCVIQLDHLQLFCLLSLSLSYLFGVTPWPTSAWLADPHIPTVLLIILGMLCCCLFTGAFFNKLPDNTRTPGTLSWPTTIAECSTWTCVSGSQPAPYFQC